MTQSYDLLVSGAGLVGLSCALYAAQKGFTVALIERDTLRTDWHPEKNFAMRVSAITPASVNLFQTLEVWDDILSKRVTPYTRMEVWDAASTGRIAFNTEDALHPQLGFIIENDVMQTSLATACQHHENITCFEQACPEALLHYDDEVQLTLGSGDTITGKLLVGADGANSWVRQTAGFETQLSPYAQHALVTTVKTSEPHHNTAYQRFCPTGPVAFLPLPDPHTASIVWSTSPEEAARLSALPEDAFNRALMEASEARLSKVECIAPRVHFPLVARHAQDYVQPGIALVGDAAHTLHPLAGQGVNLGLMDVAALIHVLVEARACADGIGKHRVLTRYQRWRKQHNTRMLHAMQGFKTFYGVETGILPKLRGFGMRLVNQSSFLKRYLIQHAMGLRGDVPGHSA